MKKIITVTAALSLAALAQAAVIVNWDGTDDGRVTASTPLTEVTTFTTGSGYQSPAVGVNGYNAVSPNFYASLNNTLMSFQIFEGGTDLIGRTQALGGAAGNFSNLLAWDVDPGNSDLTSIRIGGFGDFGVAVGAYHFVVQTSDNSWIATDAQTVAGQTMINLDTQNWNVFTPHNAGVSSVGAAVAVNAATFEGTKMVGIYDAFTTAGGGGTYQNFFEVQAVPEPATLGLIGVFGGAILFIRRRFMI